MPPKKNKTVSVVIPSYNEEARILPVISAVKNSPLITEIIVVDDGSKPSSKIILENISGITLITHPKNKGKSAAMKTGVLKALGDIILFLDADLNNLTPKHLENILMPIINDQYDFVLAERDQKYQIFLTTGLNATFAGEYAVVRKHLISNLDIFDAPGFLIEASLNKRLLSLCKSAKVHFSGVHHCYKHSKIGFKGYLNDFKMSVQIIFYLGLPGFIHQVNAVRLLPYLKT